MTSVNGMTMQHSKSSAALHCTALHCTALHCTSDRTRFDAARFEGNSWADERQHSQQGRDGWKGQRCIHPRAEGRWGALNERDGVNLFVSIFEISLRAAKKFLQPNMSDSQMKRNSTVVDRKAITTYLYLISIPISSLPAP